LSFKNALTVDVDDIELSKIIQSGNNSKLLSASDLTLSHTMQITS